MSAPDLSRKQVLAFRTSRHGLSGRRPRAELVDAVAAVGLRRTNGTPLSLAARVEQVGEEDLVQALRDGELVAVFGARGTVMVVPTRDVGVFTLGTAPTDEESLRHTLPGAFVRRLDHAEMTATDALEAVMEALRDTLAAGAIPRGEAAMAVTRALPATLTPPCRGRCPDPHVEDALFRLAGVNGVMCFDKDDDALIPLDPLLRALNPPAITRDRAREELIGRYLRCYGPSKPATLGEWAGISTADARRSLSALGRATVDVTVDGAEAGAMLEADVEHARTAEATGVRFLPAFDAYLLDRDRRTLVPERAAQQVVWRASGNPGVVIVDGEPIATWRTRQHRSRLSLVLAPLGPALPVGPAHLQEEAQRVGSLLGKAGPLHLTVQPSG